MEPLPDPRRAGRAESRDAAVRAVADALYEDLAGVRLVRADSRVKIYAAATVLSKPLSELLPPGPAGTLVRVMLYVTRPRALGLPPGRFHVLAVFNATAAFAFTAHVRARARLGGALLQMRFADAERTEPPEGLPDVAAEDAAPDPEPAFDVCAFAAPGRPPRTDDCVAVAPGAWWSFAERKLYFLRMDEPLLSLCPAGWRARDLGAVLHRLLSHPEGCEECRPPPHIDTVNLGAEEAAPDACVCAAPCLWRKARQREVPVAGDGDLFRVLFLDRVAVVRFLVPRGRAKVVRSPSDLIVGLDGHLNPVPVNDAGWRLVEVDRVAANVLICGCPRLRVACARDRWVKGAALWL
ncbi:tegument protein UL16 [Beluga whale alphaherpesvirus 1]|uniref:Tegument protein UL16 n=1 Tax=Beluga whale alphaherpesvirus 1 TaxID=1434720 RepID=A0A286MM66_9ALPH|nr:tegument protein UL16 [Beluga whale alphaherpesvirus 1]ASW27092.1 tegument protein UL16 [Beluga whale alphaherpesvirus 1]